MTNSDKHKAVKMYTKLLVVLMAVSLVPMVLSRTRRYSKMQSNTLYKIRCDLKCIDVTKEAKPMRCHFFHGIHWYQQKVQQSVLLVSELFEHIKPSVLHLISHRSCQITVPPGYESEEICKSQCRTNEKKPGTCPLSDTPKWEAACVEACNSDTQCDGTQRCCRHNCGSTCSEPIDLLTVPGLPAMPVIEEPKERKRSVVIRWSDGVGDAARAVPGQIFYVLEEQHHLGPKYEDIRLGDWSLLLRTNKTKVSLRNALKPGRWYRFRVAAVSASGTRGFSAPSPAFTPRRGPRPPPSPKKLKVRPIRENNGTVTVRLEWKEPHSDLPVMRYKVFWSRRVKGLGGELDSVLVNHQTVPKDLNFIEIKDLQPNSMYFLQVQTISQFGMGKLRSDKASIFYNTTSIARKGLVGTCQHRPTSAPMAAGNEVLPAQHLNNLTSHSAAELQIEEVYVENFASIDPAPEPLQKRENKKIKGLNLHKIVWYNHKLKAKIAWQPLSNVYEQPGRYYVHWKATKCHDPKKLRKEGLTATTEQTTFELYELDYQCTYKVNVNSMPRVRIPDSEVMLNVPACEYFKRKVNTTIINCVA